MKLKKLFAIIFLIQIGFCFAQQKAVLSFAEAKQLADRGDARAQAIVAMHYQLGWQTEKDESLAGRYAQASAEAGHPLGIYRLGNLLVSGINGQKDLQTGYKLQAASYYGLLELANPKGNSDPYAQMGIGIMLFQGKVLPQDKVTAVKAYHLAAAQGLAPAIFNYIMASIEGQGVPKDDQAFIDFFAQWDKKIKECPLDMGFDNKDCASCRVDINQLRDYPPAIKFYSDNRNKYNNIVKVFNETYTPPKMIDEYDKTFIAPETATIIPFSKKHLADKWFNLLEKDGICVRIRTNYQGLPAFKQEVTQEEMDEQGFVERQVSYPSNGSGIGSTLKNTIQYMINDEDGFLKIQPNSPLEYKNRMGFLEYPVMLEFEISNTSKNNVYVDNFGFFVADSKLINNFIPTILSSGDSLVFHNFGWPDKEESISGNVISFIPDTLRIREKNISFPSHDSLILDINLFIPPGLRPGGAGGMDTVRTKFEWKYNEKNNIAFYTPDVNATCDEFFTKFNSDVSLISNRSNYRVLFNANKSIPPNEHARFIVSFDCNQSANIKLIPFLKTNISSFKCNDISLLYETPRYPFSPSSTPSRSGNGDIPLEQYQDEISSLISKNPASFNLSSAKPLVQSKAKVSVFDLTKQSQIFYSTTTPDGSKIARISGEYSGDTIEGKFEICSAEKNEVIFRVPWSFSKLSNNEINLAVVFDSNWNWFTWCIKESEQTKLYTVFPGRNPVVFSPTSDRAVDNVDIPRFSQFGNSTESDICNIGLDSTGNNLTLVDKHNNSYLVPLGSSLAFSLQDSVNAGGVVMLYPSDFNSDKRLFLTLPIYENNGKINNSLFEKIKIQHKKADSIQIESLVWLNHNTISIKKEGQWYDLNLFGGLIIKNRFFTEFHG
jgi:hypothetical protein